MDTITGLKARNDLTRTTRKFGGEFVNPAEFVIAPSTEPHVIGYWGLTVEEVETADNFTVYYSVRLASLRTEGQCKSKFGEVYHSDTSYSRNSLLLVPRDILVAIEEVTGEGLVEVYDFLAREESSK